MAIFYADSSGQELYRRPFVLLSNCSLVSSYEYIGCAAEQRSAVSERRLAIHYVCLCSRSSRPRTRGQARNPQTLLLLFLLFLTLSHRHSSKESGIPWYFVYEQKSFQDLKISIVYLNLSPNLNLNLPPRGSIPYQGKGRRGWLRCLTFTSIVTERDRAIWPVIRAFEHQSIEPE